MNIEVNVLNSEPVEWDVDAGGLAGVELELRTESKAFTKSTRILQAKHNFVSLIM